MCVFLRHENACTVGSVLPTAVGWWDRCVHCCRVGNKVLGLAKKVLA